MKIKLDENIGVRGRELLAEKGHDASTVRDQGLSSAPDEAIFGICAAEGRVLVTLDRDFGEVLRFPPEGSAGIAMLDLGPRASPKRLLDRLRDFLTVAVEQDIRGSKIFEVRDGSSSPAELVFISNANSGAYPTRRSTTPMWTASAP